MSKTVPFGLLVALSLVSAVSTASAAPIPVNRTQFFISPETPSELKWRVDEAEAAKVKEIRIVDYWAGERARVPVAVKDGLATASVSLPAGYYELEFVGTDARFGLVVQPEAKEPYDPFFSIDSALSWLVDGDDLRRDLIRILKRSGIPMSRERLRMRSVSPGEGKYDWQADKNYETLRKDYQSAGVEVLELFHDAPEWPGRIERCYPDDLAKLVPALGAFSRRWSPTWGALEVWNEPDIFFGANLPADQYIATIKASAFALRKAGFKRPILGGSYAMSNQDYLNCSAENGMLDVVEVVSFHTYARAKDMERLVTLYRDWLKRYDHPAKPLWITECGRPWPEGKGRPDMGPDANSALDVTMKAIEARSCGIERYFPFVYPYYEERENNFAMMGRGFTPLRSMAAYVFAVRHLSDRDYAGDCRVDDEAIARARVFHGEKDAVVVLYRDQCGGENSVKPPCPVVAAHGIDGRALEPDAEGRFPLRDGILYLTVKPEEIAKHLIADTPAMALWKTANAETPSEVNAPSPIVPRYQYGEKTAFGARGYHVKPDVTPTVPFTVRVFNLGNSARSVELTPAFSNELGAFDPPAAKTVDIPAAGHADVTWTANVSHAFDKEDRVAVVVTAKGADCGTILPLSVDFHGDVPLKTVLARYAKQYRLPVDDRVKWRFCSSKGTTNRMEPTEDGHWRLVTDFGGRGGWTFPNTPMPEEFDGAPYDTLVVRIRCLQKTNVRLFLWEKRDKVGYISQSGILPSDGEWHTAVIPYSTFGISGSHQPDPNGKLDPEKVQALTVGMTSPHSKCTMEVSDVVFVGGKK